VLFFFTGVHEQYHTPDDDTERINFAGEKSIADYAYDLIVTLANQEPALAYQEAGPKSRPSTGRGFKVTLGVVPDFAGAEKTGFRIDGVRKGGPADRAGMQKGDIIVAIEGKEVKNIYDYMYRLAELKAGQRASVEFMRGDKKIILIVEL
jgi:S1-C subfamily serine protease